MLERRTDPLASACQEGITLSPTQEEVLQGFHNLQGSRKVSHVEQPGGTSYQHYSPYPLIQERVRRQGSAQIEVKEPSSLLLHVSEAKAREDKTVQFNKDHL